MQAYHNDNNLKNEIVKKALEHEAADRVIKGTYWDGHKGCSVGCLLNDPDGGHEQYPAKFGLPEWLGHLQDFLFENMSDSLRKNWTSTLMSAIKPGVNIDDIKIPFLIVVLKHSLATLNKLSVDDKDVTDVINQSKSVVEQTIAALQTGKGLENAEWAAWAAASAAMAKARAAAEAANAARWAADAAARVARVARWAAEAAANAAEAARWAAWAAWAAREAEGAEEAEEAGEAAVDYYVTELLRLIEELE